MPRVGSYSLEDVTRLRQRIEEELEGCGSFQEAAQRFADVLYEELERSAVLLRVFATVPFGSLPEKEKSFVLAVGRERSCAEEIHEKTIVLTLLGTRGRRGAWNDRYLSRRHLAIPLTSASFIKTIPMVSRLLSDMGSWPDWVDKQKSNMVVRSMGQMARLLHIEDAATAETTDGFKVVPDQDFVREHGVRTVLGLGGAYLNRSIVATLLFLNELIPQDRVEKLMPLVHGFKVATMKAVMGGNLFPDRPRDREAS